MSLILEALRKSEAERRRGQAPDLHAELPPVQTRGRSVPPWFWLATAAALLLAAALFWMRGRDAPESGPRPEQPSASAAPDNRASTDNRDRDVVESYPRVDRITAPPVAAAPKAPATSDPDEGTGANVAIAPATRTPEAAATPATPAPAVTPAEVPALPPDIPTSASAPPVNRDAIVRLSELPPAERKQLPAMKISMHMWNESPARRFVIIDGQRYVESDRIGGATVDAIDSDGVVLDLGGRAVRVPIR